MPRSLRTCTRAGCPNTTARGLCTPCRSAIPRKPRPTAHQRGYDTRWAKARVGFLAKHPRCECPDHKGKFDAPKADTVDHITAHKGDPTLFWDRSNWRAVAKACNSRKAAREEGGFGNPRCLPEDRIPQREPIPQEPDTVWFA